MDFVEALATGPQVEWIVGTVTAITGATITVNCLGGDVEDVTPVEQYTPAVGDVVHMLSLESTGMLAVGSVPLAAPRPEPGPTGVELIVDPTIIATYGPLTGQWELGSVLQDTDRVGCFFYEPAAFIEVGSMDLASFSIELTLDAGAGPPEFVEHNALESVGVLEILTEIPFGVQLSQVGVPTWLDLPLGWAADLIEGSARGIGIASVLFTGDYSSSSGRLRLTPV